MQIDKTDSADIVSEQDELILDPAILYDAWQHRFLDDDAVQDEFY